MPTNQASHSLHSSFAASPLSLALLVTTALNRSNMSTATAQCVAEVTSTQSLILLRNLMRLNFSSVLYTRGSFPEEAFVNKNVHG